MTGLIVLLVAVALTAAVAWVVSIKNGRFSDKKDVEHLDFHDLGSALGERATLVQFSSAFCAPCRATRVLLADIASRTPGVVTIEIDAEERLELTRRLNILRTPTVLVLDAEGRVTRPHRTVPQGFAEEVHQGHAARRTPAFRPQFHRHRQGH